MKHTKSKSIFSKQTLVIGLLILSFIASPVSVFASSARNLVSNASLEIPNDSVKNIPQNWNKEHNSSNFAVFLYPLIGFENTKAAGVSVGGISKGEEGWCTDEIVLSPMTQYTISDYFISNTNNVMRAKFKSANGASYSNDILKTTAAPRWTKIEKTFNSGNAVSAVFCHALRTSGFLILDNFSISPAVFISSPTQNSTVRGTAKINIGFPASISLSEVQIFVDGIPYKNKITSAPFSSNWDTSNLKIGSHSLSIKALDASGRTYADSMTVNVGAGEITTAKSGGGSYGGGGAIIPAPNPNPKNPAPTPSPSPSPNPSPIPPPVPVPTVSPNPTPAPTVAPDPTPVPTPAPIVPPDPTPAPTPVPIPVPADNDAPDVSIIDPVSETTISGTIIARVFSQDQPLPPGQASGVKQVQFYVDNVPVGSPVSALPYSANINTANYSDGLHTIGASATDNAGNQSAIIKINVNFSNNSLISPPSNNNGILNPSLELNSNGLPNNWHFGNWGTNTSTFTYPISGHSSSGAETTITNFTDGDAKWYFDDVSVTPGEKYVFQDFYKSDVPTRVTARFTMADNSLLYLDLGYPQSAANWKQFSTSFTAPASAVSMTIFHLIEAAGTLSIDDFYLTGQAVAEIPFSQGMVSLTFDDGYLATFQNGIPILNAAGIKSTHYIISGEVNDTANGYMSKSDLLDMQSNGHEIGAHTKTHPDLTTLTTAQMVDEIAGSKTDLQAMGVNTITSFAYPYGNWNETVKNIVKQSGFIDGRTALVQNEGLNYSNSDPFLLKTVSVEVNTPVSDVEQWIKEASSKKAWLILVFHQIDTGGEQYSTTPANLTQIVNYLIKNNVKTIKINEGAALIK